MIQKAYLLKLSTRLQEAGMICKGDQFSVPGSTYHHLQDLFLLSNDELRMLLNQRPGIDGDYLEDEYDAKLEIFKKRKSRLARF